jgi:hypothetical protein
MKRIWKKCPHGKRQPYCRECGGSQICEHDKRRDSCVDCGGSQLCEHNKPRSRCHACGGNQICEHGKRREYCRECGGSQVCEHGRQQQNCKDCGGKFICEHGRRRDLCKDCGGSQICIHKRQRGHCKDCGGKFICEHNRERQYCKDCSGKGLCVHQLQRLNCQICSCCEHGKVLYFCSVCKPASVFNNYKRGAARRGIPFELSLEEFKWVISYSCSLCATTGVMGCDRVDSSKGYRFDNCQPLCWPCNQMKWDRSEEEFDQHIIKIIQHRPELAERAGFVRKIEEAVEERTYV